MQINQNINFSPAMQVNQNYNLFVSNQNVNLSRQTLEARFNAVVLRKIL